MVTEITLSTFCNLLVGAGGVGVVLMLAGTFLRQTAVALSGLLCSAAFVGGVYWLATYGPLVVR